jgi:hypothetical protein
VTRPSSAPTTTSAPYRELPAHRNAVAGKAWIRDTIGELTGQLGADNPAELADHLTLALEGLLATGQALGPDGPAKQAKRLAEAGPISVRPQPIASGVRKRRTRTYHPLRAIITGKPGQLPAGTDDKYPPPSYGHSSTAVKDKPQTPPATTARHGLGLLVSAVRCPRR